MTDTDALAHLNARLDAIEQKLDRMAPARGAGLERLGDRIDKIEAAIDAFGTFAERLPVLADAAGSGATWAWRQAEAAGVDPLRAGQQGAALALELAREENLALAQKLLARRKALETALAALDGVSDDDLETVATRGAALTGTLAKLLRSAELERLLAAGAEPAALATAAGATTALFEKRNEPVEPVGPFGALFKLGDPDVKRAVGFTLALAKRFGQLLGR
ncbi:MAG: DUF1641 domain-containing protein [Myxococcota bacterium]